MSRNKLYTLLLPACIAGYIWLGFSGKVIHQQRTFRLCLWHAVTQLPCPSCGLTRSVVAILDGDWLLAAAINPLGFPVALFLLIAPLWILADLSVQGDTFFRWYKRSEHFLRRRPVAITLVLLLLINWVWNIHKEL